MAISAEQLRDAVVLAVREAVSQTVTAGASGTQGGAHHSGGWRKQLDHRGVEGLAVYKGGEVEWVDWSWKVKVALGPMSPALVELMGMAEKSVGSTTAELMAMGDRGELEGKFGGAQQASSEFYSILAKFTEGEAATLVRGVSELDGLVAWGTLHERYSRRTLGRMFRVQRECMYPKQAKNLRDVGAMVLEWEGRWKRMMAELGPDAKIPDLWRMSALLEICPRGVREAIELRLDEIGEDYAKMKANIIAYVTNRVEGGGGAVPMEVDGVLHGGDTCDTWWGEDSGGVNEVWGGVGDGSADGQAWWPEVGAVFPGTQCYQCGKYGHMARDCPSKGKSKGKGKDGGKAAGKGMGMKGVAKAGGKGVSGGAKGNQKGGGKSQGKGDVKGGGKGWYGKGYYGGYQGTCWRCGQVGHKANECGAQLVGEAAEEAVGGSAHVQELPMGGVWTVGAVETVGVEAVGGPGQRISSRWERQGRKGAGHRKGVSGAVNDVGERPSGVTLGDMMPKKVHVGNRYSVLDEDEGDGEIVGEVGEEEVEAGMVAGVVEVMVDSGASKSVWPKAMGGVARTRRNVGVKLAAANGSPIKVEGDAALHFQTGGRKCTMNFLDADVRRPLGAVSAIVDGGNTVVFSGRGSAIVNDATGEKIPLVRKGGLCYGGGGGGGMRRV